jgi:perosamine synthetase
MKVPQLFPNIGMEEYASMKDCFDNDWYTEGPKAKLFVEQLCDTIGVKYGVLAPNGTLALYLALKAIGVGKGDEVIVPNFTFIASATAVLMADAVPIFVDINRETLQIDTKDCDRVLTSKTKAIMPVHIYGSACDMTSVMSFANTNNLKVIEDAAQAMGVYWDGKHCGGFGDVGCFSFFADKTITTVEGGFVCTNDEKTYEKLMYLRNQGRLNRGTFIHPEVGFNFRMNDLQCAIGLVQMSKKQDIYDRKNYLRNIYLDKLKDVKQIEILGHDQKSSLVPFRVCITTKGNSNELAKYLDEKGIQGRTFFYPLSKQPCFLENESVTSCQDLDDRFFSKSIDAFERGLCLPVFPSLTEGQVEYVCDCIREYFDAV